MHQYEQSVKKATFAEDLELVLVFMEEFIKKHTGQTKARDDQAFKQLSDGDRENINEMLKTYGIHYKDAF